ncbi:MAG: hypothetical protein IT370_25430 [Deltaproteobacteria bacterium]|nr:hypothetical protein [Deltaproteobacteria bacterium]
MPATWTALLSMLGGLAALSGAGAAAAQLWARLRPEPSPWTIRARDGLLGSTVVMALSVGALLLYYYLLR